MSTLKSWGITFTALNHEAAIKRLESDHYWPFIPAKARAAVLCALDSVPEDACVHVHFHGYEGNGVHVEVDRVDIVR